jgi:hypothetical protein
LDPSGRSILFTNKPCNSYCRKSRMILMSRSPIRCNAQPRCCIYSSTNDTCSHRVD